jgi:hypothetical protein
VIPPSDEVLTELGRFTWLAISLEDGLGLVCRSIVSRDLSGLRLADQVKQACRTMQDWSASPHQAAIDSWLRSALEALDEGRNQIFHATPLTLVDPMAKTFSPLLGIKPRQGRRGRPDRPYLERPMTVEHLREAQAELAVFDKAWPKFTRQSKARSHRRSAEFGLLATGS